MNGANSNQFLESTKKMYQTHFPQFPTKFPILPGKYAAKNVTIITNPESEFNMTLDDYKKEDEGDAVVHHPWKFVTPKLLPNGEYRHIVKYYNDKDPEGMCIYWHNELRLRMNDDDF